VLPRVLRQRRGQHSRHGVSLCALVDTALGLMGAAGQ
jgi:hypothetical protein